MKQLQLAKQFLFFLSILVACNLKAQQLDPSNLQNLNVDELTDEQVQKFVDQVESNGYTEDQLLLLAKTRGVSDIQIQKLRQRIAKLQSGRSQTTDVPSTDRLREDLGVENRRLANDPFALIIPEEKEEDSEELEIFGLSFFKNENLTFEPSLNIPTPKNYQISAGDEIIIDVWGASEQTYQLTVSPEGSIRITGLGPIYLNGLTVDRATRRIKARLKSIYSTLGENTFADVSLGKTRSIKVHVVGEVERPGTYLVSSFATAFNALYQAGGPTKSGSLRDIRVFRGGQKIGTLDAYRYLSDGLSDGLILKDQDVISVQPYGDRVKILGEVKRPSIYEISPEESVEQAINYAGGFTEKAFTERLNIRRNDGNFKKMVTVDRIQFGNTAMQGGDEVTVSLISNQFKNRVTIEGAVYQPGEYAWSEGLTLSQLLEQAQGLQPDAFKDRAIIVRQNDDFTLSNTSISLNEVMDGEKDYQLQNEDLITIKSIFDLREAYFVRVEGEVLKPGRYPYIAGQTVEDLVYLAGGFKESAAKSSIEVARRVGEQNNQNQQASAEIFQFPIQESLAVAAEDAQFELQAFDLVVIRKSPFFEDQSMIEVEGEVQFPGKYALRSKEERISDIIKRSGGLTSFAYAKGATLIRQTEYYATDEDGGDTRARIRRQELGELLERDTLLDKSQQDFKKQEPIGIQLEEVLKNPKSKYDLLLKEGDVISIPKELQTVRVRGEVLYPSNIRFDNGMSFKSYIARAGGFSDQARRKKSYVIYANGSAKKTGSFLWWKTYPRVEPGAEVIVPEKPQKRKLTPQEVLGITTGVATLGLLVNQIVNQL
ncbi:MAG: SLBB domain-containing protein [Cyclobacteriaceae bacterium]|nr:SLBB domain-containing protein [Cyclobacteriaceae bacterium HetDA_MAG_MS6]